MKARTLIPAILVVVIAFVAGIAVDRRILSKSKTSTRLGTENPEAATPESDSVPATVRGGPAREEREETMSLAQIKVAIQNLGKLAIKQQKYAEADSDLHKALAVEPLNPESLLYAAQAAAIVGHFDECAADVRTLHTVAGHEKYAIGHFMAARAQLALPC